MVATNWPRRIMEKLLRTLAGAFPHIQFVSGEAFFWSPATTSVTYKQAGQEESHHAWALLHETAHALLNHQNYEHDVDLLLLEVAAWQKAKELGVSFGVEIDEEHVQDCLDTYRDWLHQRSTCPRCSTVSLQISAQAYRCHNCAADWQVSASRFCRPYRLSKNTQKKSPAAVPQATFQ